MRQTAAVLTILAALVCAAPCGARGFDPVPTEPELADVFARMAHGYLQRADISDARRAELTAEHYTAEKAAVIASAIYHGLAHWGLLDSPKASRYMALVMATIWQQSSGKGGSLSRADPTEPVGEDVGLYQVRLSVVFRAGGCWDETYPDRMRPETREDQATAMLNPMTAAPIWLCHLLRQERSCGHWLRTIRTVQEARRKLSGPNGESPTRYCKAVWFQKTPPATVHLGLLEVETPGTSERKECGPTRRCYVVRGFFGVATYNMGATNVTTWGKRYRQALRAVRGGAI